MQLIDGKATAAAIKEQIAQEVAQIVAAGGKQPHLVAVLVGHDGGSETYVKNKVLACEKCGFKSTLIRYEEDVTEEELLQCVDKLNQEDDVDGFIVQLPLPKHIDEQKVTMAIDYRKDVDGFHPVNVGRMSLGMPCFISATPLGILTLLQHYNIETSGKKCVILGRSNIVGKPMAQLMMQKQYGDAEHIQIMATKGFSEKDPYAAAFFRNFSLDNYQLSELMDLVEGHPMHEEEGAKIWLSEHPEVNEFFPTFAE